MTKMYALAITAVKPVALGGFTPGVMAMAFNWVPSSGDSESVNAQKLAAYVRNEQFHAFPPEEGWTHHLHSLVDVSATAHTLIREEQQP